MPVKQQIGKTGAWQINLIPTTPLELTARMAIDSVNPYAFGHIVITPSWIDARLVSTATLMSLARFVGVYLAQPARTELTGEGLEWWLGSGNGTGDLPEVPIAFGAGTFATWVTTLCPAALTLGTITAIAGNLNWATIRNTARNDLDYICRYFGGEWQVTQQGVVNAGPAPALYGTTPTCMVHIGDGGREPRLVGLAGTPERDTDVLDYVSRVLVIGAAGNAGQTRATIPYKNLLGAPVSLKRRIDDGSILAGTEAGVALGFIIREGQRRESVGLTDVRSYDVSGDIIPGRNMWLWNPSEGVVDTANEIVFRGEITHPQLLRCMALAWPITRGMGVYFRDGDGRITDLTPWVAWESGSAAVEIGAPTRRWTEALRTQYGTWLT